METTYYGVSLLYIFIVVLVSGAIYSITFFYLMSTYVKIGNVYIHKKTISSMYDINNAINDLTKDKKFLDYINTSMNTVINFKAINYNTDILTISLDKFNNTIHIISTNCNKTIVLGNNTSRSEIKYIEDELLKRVPKGK